MALHEGLGLQLLVVERFERSKRLVFPAPGPDHQFDGVYRGILIQLLVQVNYQMHRFFKKLLFNSDAKFMMKTDYLCF